MIPTRHDTGPLLPLNHDPKETAAGMRQGEPVAGCDEAQSAKGEWMPPAFLLERKQMANFGPQTEPLKMPTLEQADNIIVAALALALSVARYLGLAKAVEVIEYVQSQEDVRHWILSNLGLTDTQAVHAEPEQLGALGGIGSDLVSIVSFIKQWAPLIQKLAPLVKEYGPYIKQALELAKMLFDAWQAKQAPTIPAPAPVGPGGDGRPVINE